MIPYGQILLGAAALLGVVLLAARVRATVLERRLRAIGIPPDLPHREQSRFIRIDGVSLHYQEAGEGDLLVLIHGFGASTVSWSFVFRALAERHRVIAVDLKGFGLSGAPRDRRYSLQAHTAVIAHLLDHLGVQEAAVCGNSLGGSVALKLALDRPDLVSRLILIAAAVDVGSREQTLLRVFRRPGVGESIASVMLASSWFVRREMMRIYRVCARTITDERVRLYHRSLATAGTHYAALSTLRQWHVSDLDDQLTHVRQPALVLWGAGDRVVPVETARALAAKLRCAELVILEGCGHSPEEELPEAVLERIERFIGSGQPGTVEVLTVAGGG